MGSTQTVAPMQQFTLRRAPEKCPTGVRLCPLMPMAALTHKTPAGDFINIFGGLTEENPIIDTWQRA